MASSGIVLNGSTATWTITAADCATLPLGIVDVSLKIWYGTRLSDTINGTLNVRDTSLGAATTTATWSSVLSVAATQTSLLSGSAFSSTLTFTNAGTPVSPTYVDWRLTYQPQGSISEIVIPIPSQVIVSGQILYTNYVSGIFPRPTPVWPSVTVDLHKAADDSLIASTTTDSGGLYQFIDKAINGESVYVKVLAQLPPGEGSNEQGTSANSTAVYGVTVIDLTCDRPPI